MGIVKFNLTNANTYINKSGTDFFNTQSMPPLFSFNNSYSNNSAKYFENYNKMFSLYLDQISKSNYEAIKKLDFTKTSDEYSKSKPHSTRLTGNLGKDIVSTAEKYIGYKETDNSYKLFTQGRTEAWCADFVTHVVKESAQANGKSLPANFGSSSVEELRQWGLRNNCYLETASASNKADTIKSKVKAGDAVIFKENGSSHTGIVAQVNSDGSIKTIEGNTSDKVAYRNYSANDAKISGFVQVA